MQNKPMLWVAALIAGWAAQGPVQAAVLRVCQSGCAYSTVQAAINAVQDGDVVEIEAGQVFSESLRFPARTGVTVRTSRWEELPPLEERIDPVAHAALLPIIRMPNRNSTAMSMGQQESVVSQDGVDIVNNTIRFDSSPGLGNNVPVACFGTALPQPLAARTKYYIRNWNAGTRTGQLALAPDGPVIDLLGTGSAGSSNYYVRPRCTAWDSPHDWTFRGIRFEALENAGGPVGWLVNVGSNEQPAPEMGPNRIRFHQVVVSGLEAENTGPSFCLVLAAGSGHEVISSWIGHCKATGGVESKAIWLQNVEDVEIRNNYISAASINILTAGSDSARMEVVKNIRIRGNFVEKPGYMMYRQGEGEPAGECYYGGGSGAFYRRTDVSPNTCENGACYTCQPDNTWALNTEAVYRPGNFLTKNLIELKDCDGCVVEANVFRGAYVGPDAGQGACASITAATGAGFGSGYHLNYNVIFQNNWCDQVYGGLSASNGVISGPGFDQLPMRNIHFENNLITNLGRFPALSQWPTAGTVNIRNFTTGQAIDGLRFRNNTFRVAPGAQARNAVMIGPGAWPAQNQIQALDMRNNIFQFNGAAGQCAFCISFPPAESNACNASGFYRFVPESTDKQVRNNLFYGGNYSSSSDFIRSTACLSRNFGQNEFVATTEDVGFADYGRLASSSPFSAAHANPQLLSTDGADLGADIDVLEMYTKPALAGKPSMPEQLKVSVEAGKTQAVIRYTRPGENACAVRLYDGAARKTSNLVVDTNSAARQHDERDGNVVESAAVQFLAGFFEPLQTDHRYQYEVNCGELWAIGWLQTRPAAGETPEDDVVIEIGETGDQGLVERSLTADFANAETLPAAAAAGGQIQLRLPPVTNTSYIRYRIVDQQGQTRKQSGTRILIPR